MLKVRPTPLWRKDRRVPPRHRQQRGRCREKANLSSTEPIATVRAPPFTLPRTAPRTLLRLVHRPSAETACTALASTEVAPAHTMAASPHGSRRTSMRINQFLVASALAALFAFPAMARGGGHGGSGARSGSHGSNHGSATRGATASHSVRAYTTRKGTYVAAHRATNPDHTKANNWSTRGNVNPYTGKPGTKSF